MIEARFENGAQISVYLRGEDAVHAVIQDPQGNLVTSSGAARRVQLPTVAIMPQVAPVSEEEKLLSEEYVLGAMSSRLAPLHFRNQLLRLPDLLPRFRQAVEDTWPGVRVGDLIRQGRLPDVTLALQVRNEDFVADVFNMGHGLQMWLQAMWFLVRSQGATTVILDEPDVYMHADLQRRLIRYVRTMFPQLVVATHSVEIISEVEADDILIVDRRRPASSFATSLPAVQQIISRIGSTQNLQLTRLWSSRRMLLVEGEDIGILRRLQNRLYPHSQAPFDTLPNMSIGGWNGWPYAIGTALAMRNAVNEEVITYCILDSDHHAQELVDRRRAEAVARGVSLYVWPRKEIENYLLVSAALGRIIRRRLTRGRPPSDAEIEERINEIAEILREEAFDATSASILACNRALGPVGANREARAVIRERIQALGGLEFVVSGKELLARLSTWAQERFGVSLNAGQLATELQPDEIHRDLAHVIRAIELQHRF
ncbi:MAG: AAA family ATPase [Dehalococcoidia bacterium]